MTTMAFLLQCGSAIAALIAAWFWYKSSLTPAPAMTWSGIGTLQAWLDDVAAKNKRAAIYAALSAALGAVGTFAGLS